MFRSWITPAQRRCRAGKHIILPQCSYRTVTLHCLFASQYTLQKGTAYCFTAHFDENNLHVVHRHSTRRKHYYWRGWWPHKHTLPWIWMPNLVVWELHIKLGPTFRRSLKVVGSDTVRSWSSDSFNSVAHFARYLRDVAKPRRAVRRAWLTAWQWPSNRTLCWRQVRQMQRQSRREARLRFTVNTQRNASRDTKLQEPQEASFGDI